MATGPAGNGHTWITALLYRGRDWLSGRLLETGQAAATPDGVAYNVVFTGRYTLPEAEAITNMAAFFKLGQVNTQRLLQAGRTLKSYPDKAPADKLARLLTRAGAECRVEMEIPAADDEPGAAQKVAFALENVTIPEIHLPDVRQFGRRQWGFIGTLVLLLAAIGTWQWLRPPVIGGDTLADYEASVERMVARADPADGPRILHAVEMLTASARAAQEQSATTDPATAARLIYAPVEGKTAEELLAQAEARLERQREAYRRGLAEADQKIAAINDQLAAIAPDNAVVLARISIEEAAFGWPTGASGPTIVFTVRNNSHLPLSRILMQGYLYDSSGKLLASHPLTYAVSGGIAPGLARSVALPMPHDSPWAVQKARKLKDVVLKLRVANAENREGESLGIDYRPLEAERQRHLDWKAKTQAELEAIRL